MFLCDVSHVLTLVVREKTKAQAKCRLRTATLNTVKRLTVLTTSWKD